MDALASQRSRILGALRNRGNKKKEFIRYSDLRVIWGYREIDIVFGDTLSLAQRDYVWSNLIRFVSFLVWIEIDEKWFLGFRDRLFSPPHSTCSTLREPEDFPLSDDTLTRLGIDSFKIERFRDDQFLFMPATLDFHLERTVQRIPDSRRRLPLEGNTTKGQSGGHGTVDFWRISPDNFHNTTPYDQLPVAQAGGTGTSGATRSALAVAVKTFHRRDENGDNARVEVENLKMLKGTLNAPPQAVFLPHVIIEHGAEPQGPHFSIIFPLAPLGNLEQFLYSYDAPGDDGVVFSDYSFEDRFPGIPQSARDVAAVILEQCAGIVEALKFLHEGFDVGVSTYQLAHFDVKPDNIVICAGGRVGTWKLTDYGISAIRQAPIQSPRTTQAPYSRRTMATQAKRIPSTYQAPEIQQAQENMDLVGRKSDIWSIAAIFSELLTFVLCGSDGVKRFADEREEGSLPPKRQDFFYSSAPDGSFIIRSQVTEWLRQFGQRPEGFARCWAKCVQALLVVDPDHRPEANRLVEFVRHVQQHNSQADSEPADCIFDSNSFTRPFARPALDVTLGWQASASASLPAGDPALELVVPQRPDSAHQSMGEISPTSAAVSTPPRKDSSITTRSSDSARQTESRTVTGPLKAKESQTRGRSLGVVGALDMAVDGRRLAYLVESKVLLFAIIPELDIEAAVHQEQTIQLPKGERYRWKHVAIASPVLAVWGLCDKDYTPLLHIVILQEDSGHPAPRALDFERHYQKDLKKFEHRRRVAVSSLGLVAVIVGPKILVLDAKGEPPAVLKLDSTYEDDAGFVDSAFNEKGDTLYAWAMGQGKGVLISWKVEGFPTNTAPQSVVYYGCDENEDPQEVKLFPYNSQHGCIVGASKSTKFFPAVIGRQRRGLRPRHICQQLQVADVRAACMFNDQSLIAVHDVSGFILRNFGVLEYPLEFGQNDTLGQGRTMCKLKNKPQEKTLVRIFNDKEAPLLLVCHLDSKIDLVKLEPRT